MRSRAPNVSFKHALLHDRPSALSNNRLLQEVATFALERLQPRVVSFEEQVALLRESLAGVYEKEESWSAAAQVCHRSLLSV